MCTEMFRELREQSEKILELIYELRKLHIPGFSNIDVDEKIVINEEYSALHKIVSSLSSGQLKLYSQLLDLYEEEQKPVEASKFYYERSGKRIPYHSRVFIKRMLTGNFPSRNHISGEITKICKTTEKRVSGKRKTYKITYFEPTGVFEILARYHRYFREGFECLIKALDVMARADISRLTVIPLEPPHLHAPFREEELLFIYNFPGELFSSSSHTYSPKISDADGVRMLADFSNAIKEIVSTKVSAIFRTFRNDKDFEFLGCKGLKDLSHLFIKLRKDLYVSLDMAYCYVKRVIRYCYRRDYGL